MDTSISVVFSWDPRTRTWVKERGPDDAARPPAAPLDTEAVQTYFLDPRNGQWTSTILGLRARALSEQIAGAHRVPREAGLASVESVGHSSERAGSRATLAAGVATLLLLGGAAIVAGQVILGPSEPAAATSNVPAAIIAGGPAPQGSVTPTSVPTAEPAAAPAASVAPTPRPPQTVRWSVRLPNGTQIVYAGPDTVAQGSTLHGVFSVVLPPGQSTYQSLTVYLGDPNTQGAMTSAFGRPDANGNVVLSISGQLPRGAQALRVNYGQTPGVYTLGTITIR